MPREKVIGILGGMGPEATLDCFAKIIKHTPASKDQDHLRVLIDSNPKIPDRTAAILGQGQSPLPALIASARSLERAGAEFLIMPCVSAHFFIDDLQKNISLPCLSIFEAVITAVRRSHIRLDCLGLLATKGTIQGGLFQQKLFSSGIKTLACDPKNQEKVMEAIYEIKKSAPHRTSQTIKEDLVQAASTLIKAGAQVIIAGCTEIPLALKQKDLPVPYFDVLELLACEAVHRAGLEPAAL